MSKSEKIEGKVEAITEAATEAFTAKATEMVAEVREAAAGAAEKGKKLLGDVTEFQKANLEALVEAGKIAAKGAKEMGENNVEFAKSNFEGVQAAVKEMTAIKTPTDFMKFQSEYARKGFDTAIAQTSKNTEAFVKLAGEIFQPISNRFAVAADLIKKAA